MLLVTIYVSFCFSFSFSILSLYILQSLSLSLSLSNIPTLVHSHAFSLSLFSLFTSKEVFAILIVWSQKLFSCHFVFQKRTFGKNLDKYICQKNYSNTSLSYPPTFLPYWATQLISNLIASFGRCRHNHICFSQIFMRQTKDTQFSQMKRRLNKDQSRPSMWSLRVAFLVDPLKLVCHYTSM